jgi:large repetitive protein
VGSCTGTCASSVAAMIMDKAFVAPAGVCNADSLDDLVPQDRGYRLLSSLEYNNSVRDLLGLTGNIDITSGRIPADIAVNGFKTNANAVFTNDFAKGYVLAAEVAADMVSNIYSLAPSCSTVTCFVQTFGKRAYRRPLTTAEVTSLVNTQAAQGNKAMLTAIFSAPAMLYRSEVGVANGSGYYKLTDYEIAAMLSYTYWATTPDASLMAAADAGQLNTPAQISAKVTSMLADPKAKVAFERFITGWLDLDKDIKTTALSASLKADMKAETIEFVKRTVFEGGTYGTLLNAKYSYMTQQLATHYGLTWPGGTGMQRVDYTGMNAERSGVLGHAGILAIQSASEKTHPVKRGLFVRRNLMCQDFPPPPVGAVLKPQEDPSLTVRQRFETAHLQSGCEACHQYIDGIGFGLENYNALGKYVTTETTDNGLIKAINSAGSIGSLNSAETYLSQTEPVVAYQGMAALAGLVANSSNGPACYARQWYRYTRGQHEEVTDSCTLQTFGKVFKSSPNGSLLDLMVQFTQTKNYTLRK